MSGSVINYNEGVVLGNYILGTVVSTNVRIATRRSDGKRVALKFVKLESNFYISAVCNPYVVCLYDFFIVSKYNYHIGILVFEYMDETLKEWIETHPLECSMIDFVQQLIGGLQYIHTSGYAHQNIGLFTIFVSSSIVKYSPIVSFTKKCLGTIETLQKADIKELSRVISHMIVPKSKSSAFLEKVISSLSKNNLSKACFLGFGELQESNNIATGMLQKKIFTLDILDFIYRATRTAIQEKRVGLDDIYALDQEFEPLKKFVNNFSSYIDMTVIEILFQYFRDALETNPKNKLFLLVSQRTLKYIFKMTFPL